MVIPRWARLTAPAVAAILAVTVGGPTPAQAQEAPDSQIVQLAAVRDQALRKQVGLIKRAQNRLISLNEMQVDIMGYKPGTKDPRSIARQMMLSRYGWGDAQFTCYDNIIMRESGWNPLADNPTSSAYGIPQALPGKRMAQFGSDWRTNPVTQITWGLWYIKDRYGTPCNGWTFKKAHGWY
ncbi:MAG: transglycosylase SLT domain-containing protein [Propionicimonas sp.]